MTKDGVAQDAASIGQQAAVPRGAALLVAAAMFMEQLDGTILANALPYMARDFAVPAVDLEITITAYLTAVAICIPASAWLAARLGGARLYTLSIALFTVASTCCAVAPGVGWLVAARIAQGAAAAMMLPVGRLLVLRDLPKDQLVHAIALLTWPALLAPAIAPPLGGLIVEHLDWRWIFVLNVPLGLLGVLLAPRVLPDLDLPGQRRFDWRGFAAWAVAAGALIVLVGDGARMQAPLFWFLLLVCAGVGGWFLLHLRGRADAILDLTALSVRSFTHTVVGGSLVRMAIFAVPFLLPLMFQLGIGMSPVEAGFLIMLGMIGNIGMKPFTTAILRRFTYRTVLLVNGSLLSIGFAMFMAVDALTPKGWLITLLVITGALRSMHFTSLNTLAFRDIDPARMAGANTLFSTVQQINAALGIAVAALAVSAFVAVTGAAEAGLAAYHFGFACIAATALAGTIDAWRVGPVRAGGTEEPETRK